MNNGTKQKFVIVSLVIATFLMAIEGTIVSTAMPKIVGDLGGGHLYTWVISVYLLTTVIFTPIFGKLADLYGRKIMFTIGVIIFLTGSLASGFSQTMEQLVLFRAVQGIGAGALGTIPFTIIGDVFTLEERGKVQGWISSVWGVSGIIGPLVGGFIVDYISWHWIFFMNLPFGILSLLFLWFSLHEKIEKKKQTIDYAGILTFALTMASLLLALTLWKEERHLSESTFFLFIVSLVGLCLFLWIEAKGEEPMLPLSLFKIPVITIANIAGFLLGFILITQAYYIPLWVQGVTNSTATMSGIAMLPNSVFWLFGAVLAGKWFGKWRVGRIVLTGISLIAIGCIGLVLFETNTTIPWMMAVSAVIGFGFGIANTAYTVAVQSAVEWGRRGAAMGSHSLMRNLGQAIGIALSGLLLTDELTGTPLESSLHSVFVIMLLSAFIAFLVSTMLMKKETDLSLD